MCLMSASLEPTPEQMAALAARRPRGRPALAARGRHRPLCGRFTRAGHRRGEKPWWDAIIVVEYPSPAAFLDMVSDRGDLIATSIWTLAD
jgi:hypothetical protein